jgi:hypothetical protein
MLHRNFNFRSEKRSEEAFESGARRCGGRPASGFYQYARVHTEDDKNRIITGCGEEKKEEKQKRAKKGSRGM